MDVCYLPEGAFSPDPEVREATFLNDMEIFTFIPSDDPDPQQEEEIVHMYIASNQYHKMYKEETSERPGS